MQANFLPLLVSDKVVLFFVLAEIGIAGNDGKPALQCGLVQRAPESIKQRGIVFQLFLFQTWRGSSEPHSLQRLPKPPAPLLRS